MVYVQYFVSMEVEALSIGQRQKHRQISLMSPPFCKLQSGQKRGGDFAQREKPVQSVLVTRYRKAIVYTILVGNSHVGRIGVHGWLYQVVA